MPDFERAAFQHPETRRQGCNSLRLRPRYCPEAASEGARVVVNDLDSAPAERGGGRARAAGDRAVVCVGRVIAPNYAERFVSAAVENCNSLRRQRHGFSKVLESHVAYWLSPTPRLIVAPCHREMLQPVLISLEFRFPQVHLALDVIHLGCPLISVFLPAGFSEVQRWRGLQGV